MSQCSVSATNPPNTPRKKVGCLMPWHSSPIPCDLSIRNQAPCWNAAGRLLNRLGVSQARLPAAILRTGAPQGQRCIRQLAESL